MKKLHRSWLLAACLAAQVTLAQDNPQALANLKTKAPNQ
jgi:hypothetical protein